MNRGVSRIGRRRATLATATFDGVVEDRRRILAARCGVEFVTRHHRAGARRGRRQHFSGLICNRDSSAGFAEFAGAPIEFEDAELR